MKSHIKASFYTATLYTGQGTQGTEDWLLPARSRAAINPLPTPRYCELVLNEYIWLPLENFYDGENGYTFVFIHKGQYWHLDQTHYGYDYLCERYLSIINDYEQARLEAQF